MISALIAVSDVAMYTVSAFFVTAALVLAGGLAYLDSKEENL